MIKLGSALTPRFSMYSLEYIILAVLFLKTLQHLHSNGCSHFSIKHVLGVAKTESFYYLL